MMFLTHFEARRILEAKEDDVTISLDLGKSMTRVKTSHFDKSQLKKIAEKPNDVFFLENGVLYIAALAANPAVRLQPTSEGHAPTFTLSGIRMHVSKQPEVNARLSVKLARVEENDEVLDICTGLGYTAIEAAKLGARVTTIEKNAGAIELMHINPWSAEYFEYEKKDKIRQIIGDAFVEIKKLKSNSFDAIIHDPPRFALAGQLYSQEFYAELFRVSKPPTHPKVVSGATRGCVGGRPCSTTPAARARATGIRASRADALRG